MRDKRENKRKGTMTQLPAIIGVSLHNGWAELVTVAASEGSVEVIDRRHVGLIDGAMPSQPYHHETLELSPDDAEMLVAVVRGSAILHARSALSEVQSDIGRSYRVHAIAIKEPPLPQLPKTVAEAHSSHTIMFAADGMLYHDVVCRTAAALGLAADICPRGEEVQGAVEALGVTEAELNDFLDRTGKRLGAPWRKEHRTVAAAAIGALSKHAALKGLAF